MCSVLLTLAATRLPAPANEPSASAASSLLATYSPVPAQAWRVAVLRTAQAGRWALDDEVFDRVILACSAHEAARLTAGGIDIQDSPLGPAAIAELVQLIEEGVISSKIAKDVFERMWNGEGAASAIVEKQGLKQVSDTGALEGIIDALIAANPGQAAAVKEKPQAIGWFVGQVMKETGGKANPGVINQLLKSKLGL